MAEQLLVARKALGVFQVDLSLPPEKDVSAVPRIAEGSQELWLKWQYPRRGAQSIHTPGPPVC